MADALASGASVRKDVGVQVPPSAPTYIDKKDAGKNQKIKAIKNNFLIIKKSGSVK